MLHPKLKIWLKELLIALVILTLALNLISYIRSPLERGTALPKMELRVLDGTPIELHSQRSKPLLLHFWATWCPTCKLEAGHIESLSHHFDVLSVAVKSGSDAELKRYMDANGYTFAVASDPEGAFAAHFNIAAYPTTLIYNPSGSLSFAEVGYSSTLGLHLRMLLASYL
ncbi:MAG: protein disulfide oxidoreductase [Campylobacterales bacterium]|nr:protein disulfide oxidoreductase [Campylobacterales bacterium]